MPWERQISRCYLMGLFCPMLSGLGPTVLPEAGESTARGPDALSGRVLWVQRKADENKAAVCTRPSCRKL